MTAGDGRRIYALGVRRRLWRHALVGTVWGPLDIGRIRSRSIVWRTLTKGNDGMKDYACPVCHATLPEHEAYCHVAPSAIVECEFCCLVSVDTAWYASRSNTALEAMKRVGWEQVPDGWCCPACAESRERAINGEV